MSKAAKKREKRHCAKKRRRLNKRARKLRLRFTQEGRVPLDLLMRHHLEKLNLPFSVAQTRLHPENNRAAPLHEIWAKADDAKAALVLHELTWQAWQAETGRWHVDSKTAQRFRSGGWRLGAQ